jgi:LmbE family N-acetylglucosaminyl deacetylase
MKEPLKTLARKGANLAGACYLMGPGVKRLSKFLPKPTPADLEVSWDNVLVLAPHPDDEVFGAGLLLNKLQEQQARVTIAYITSGGAYHTNAGRNRKKEAEASADRLGAEGVFMDFQDGRLQNAPGLEEKLADLFAQIRPQAVLLPWFGDYHSDHRALARAAIGRPDPQAQYLFYSTFSPLWPSPEFKMSYILGGEEKIQAALAAYRASVNQETVSSFMVLRRALARVYLHNNIFWEPLLTISGADVGGIRDMAANWPSVYPTLKRPRHWRRFLRQLRNLHRMTS